MFLVTRQQTRPNTSVEFFGPDNPVITEETKTYVRENYVITGKQLNSERSVTEDGLTLTMQTIYQSEEAFEEYKNDQFLIENLISKSAAYCEANGIQQTLVSKDIM